MRKWIVVVIIAVGSIWFSVWSVDTAQQGKLIEITAAPVSKPVAVTPEQVKRPAEVAQPNVVTPEQAKRIETLLRSASPETEQAMLKKAMAGDYQAQRNLAFSYARGWPDIQQNEIQGCAWYQLILLSGSLKIHSGDVSNMQVYCGRLDVESRIAADAVAERLLQRISP